MRRFSLCFYSRLCGPDGDGGTELSLLCDSQLTNKPDNDCDIKECLLSLIIQHVRKHQSGSNFVVQSKIKWIDKNGAKQTMGDLMAPLCKN